MTKTACVYKIEMLMRSRGHVSFQARMDELQVSPPTPKRDLEHLKDQLGAPIVYDRFLNNYKFSEKYRGQKHVLPDVWFNAREPYGLLMAHQMLSELDTDGVLILRHGGHLKVVAPASLPGMVRQQLKNALEMNAA